MNTDITLRKNQTNFLEFSQNTCPNKNGFLLYHIMGSGKTITALSWAMNYPNHKIFIITPKYSVSIWNNEIKNLKLKTNIQFISWDDFFLDFRKYRAKIKNKLLILDEVHHLPIYLNKINNYIIQDEIINILEGYHKILCLTGTPIITDISDLGMIINLIAKDNVLPLNKDGILSKYGLVKREKAHTFKHLTTKFNNNYFHNFKLFSLDVIVIGSILTTIYTTYNKYIDKFIQAQQPRDWSWKKFRKNPFQNFKDKITGEIEKKINKDVELKKKLVTYQGVKDKIRAVEEDFTKLTSPEEVRNLKYGAAAIIIFFVMYVIMRKMYFYRDYSEEKKKTMLENDFDLKQFYDLDHESLNNNVGIYINYYYPNIHDSNNTDYPYVSEEIVFTEYTLEQNKIIIELITNHLSKESLMSMQLSKFNNIEIFKSNSNDMKDYLKYGRIISNISNINKLIIFNNLEIIFNEKYGFKLNSKEKNYFLKMNNNEIIKTLPEKYQRIITNYLKNNEKTVIYSNFKKQGFETISIILNILNIKHYILYNDQKLSIQKNILDDFNNAKEGINLMLLSPKIYESIGLKNIKHLHILEPIKEYSIRKQLIARCVRFKSHNTLFKKDRSIKIYDYICKQAVLIYGNYITLKDEINKCRKYEKNELKKIGKKPPLFNRIHYNTKNIDKNKLKKREIASNDKNILTTIISNMIEPLLGNKLKSGETKIELHQFASKLTGPNKKLLKYINSLIKSDKGGADIFDTYNFMYGPTKRRKKFFINPDEHAYMQCENNRILINLFSKTLDTKKMGEFCLNNNCKECIHRECKIWLPNDSGNCKDLN
jgi:hypothetical protein